MSTALPAEEVRRVKLGEDGDGVKGFTDHKGTPLVCPKNKYTSHILYTHMNIVYIYFFIPIDTSHTYQYIHYIHIHTVCFLAFNTK